MILKSELKKLDIYNIKINAFLFFGYSINIKNEKILRVSMLLERNLTIFEESEELNPNGLWFSEIRSVIRVMDYYMLDNDFQTNINYRIILWV